MIKRKVLLAEDDKDDQQFFIDFIKDRKDLVLMSIADNGESLLKILAGNYVAGTLPDLIVLDQNMPKLNGLETLELLKGDRRYIHIPVGIYSTYLHETLKKKGTEKGACLVVAKPMSIPGYDQMLNTLLQHCLPAETSTA